MPVPHIAPRSPLVRLAPLALVAALWGCSQMPPQLLTLRDHELTANTTLEFDVAATDPDSSQLTFAVSPQPRGAQLVQIEGKLARFSWTPNPAQVGLTTLTFEVDDGTSTDTETINIKVTSDAGPELVSPDRYVVDPAETQVKFVLEWQNLQTSSAIDFAFDPDPVTWGASLGVEARRISFSWTPTDKQKEQAEHSFVVTATDALNRSASRTISIVFHGGQANCPTEYSTPTVTVNGLTNQSGGGDYAIVAQATDAETPIARVLVSWTTVAEPTEDDWQSAPLTYDSGETWRGVIPNLRLGPGESAQVTYKACALDDDDPTGEACDGWACSETHAFTATAGLGLCDPCTYGVDQCTSGLCLTTQRGESFCGSDCSSTACPAGFACSAISVGGSTSRQCIPEACVSNPFDATCSCSGGRPVAPSAGDLVINEVLYDAPSACPDGMATCDSAAKLAVDVNGDGTRKRAEDDEEFIELVNATTRKNLDLQGVTLSNTKGVRFTFPAFVLPPGRAVVVFGGGDATRFGNIGGAFKFSSYGTCAQYLSLVNSGDSVTASLGAVQLDKVQWTGSVTNQAVVRQKEGDPSAALSSHSTAPGASGNKYSPGTHTCGTPFPLDPEACVAPACTISNRDADPQSDQRSTAPCLKPLPQTLTGTLKVDPANPSAVGTDVRDLYALEGQAGQWLHARTGATASGAVGDTVLRLLARNGTQVDKNDDDPWAAGNFYSRLVTQLPSTGIYFLEVAPFVRQSLIQGGYTLTVELSATQPTP